MKAAYRHDKIATFCATLLEVRSRLDFAPAPAARSTYLEGDRLINKDEIDAAQDLINDCRKNGDLPLDVCSEDGKRAAANLENINASPEREAADIFAYVQEAERYDTPLSFWDDLDTYVQMATEKSNPKNLFAKLCAEILHPDRQHRRLGRSECPRRLHAALQGEGR